MCNHPHEPLISGIFAHPASASSDYDESHHEHTPPTPVWTDTMEQMRTWASTITQLSHHLNHLQILRPWTLQTVGQVFLALSQEESACAHYLLIGNRLRYPPSVVAEGMEQCLTDLHDAYLCWVGVGYWLERIMNHYADWLGHMATFHADWLQQRTMHRRDPDLVEVLRPCITQVRAHQQRLWLLLCALQEELAELQQQAHQREAHT